MTERVNILWRNFEKIQKKIEIEVTGLKKAQFLNIFREKPRKTI